MTPLFEVKNLSAGYEKPIVEQISFSAKSGEIIGILGRNGCGKTTLLRGITGTNRRFGGSVFVNGMDCTKLSVRRQASHISMLPQRTEILDGILAREVLEMGLYPRGNIFHDVRKKEQNRLLEIAERLGISELLDKDCGKLSQGQRQLVLLARVMVQDAQVLLLDEPDSALDFYNTHSLFSNLRAMIRKTDKTAVIVLHDPELALRWCDRLFILHKGQLAKEISCHADIQELQNTFRILYPEIKLKNETRISFCL